MDEVKEGRQRKLIKWVIFVLAIIAIGLAVAIVIIAITGNKEPSNGRTPDNNSNEKQLSESEKMFLFFDDNMEELDAQVDELLTRNPDDGIEAERIYKKYIDKILMVGADELTTECAQHGAEVLLSKGFKKEALDLLMFVNLDYYMNTAKCKVIFDIISLAREVEDEEILSKYEKLAANTDDGFGRTCDISIEDRELYGN